MLESTLRMQADMFYMTAMASLHSHDKADVEKGAGQVSNMYFEAMSRVPYFTGGKQGVDVVQESRQAAIERYREMKRRAIKPDSEDKNGS